MDVLLFRALALLGLAILVALAARRLRLPYTVGLVLAGAAPLAAEAAIAVVALAPGATCCICCSMSPTVVPKRADWSLNTAPLPGPEAVTATRASPVRSPGVSVVALTVKVTANELPSLLFST